MREQNKDHENIFIKIIIKLEKSLFRPRNPISVFLARKIKRTFVNARPIWGRVEVCTLNVEQPRAKRSSTKNRPCLKWRCKPEVESSRTSLKSSRTSHFEVLGLGFEGQVLGLGLEASSPRKLACPRLEDSTIF